MPPDPLAADAPGRAVARASKQPYHPPRLTSLGSLAEVTRTSEGGPDTDGGGSPPNAYVS